MPRLRKAWLVRPKWADAANVFFAETASKARYAAFLKWTDYHCGLTLPDIQVKRAAHADVTLPDEHRLVAELTVEQRYIVAHAFGEGRRNYFCTDPSDLNMLPLAWEFGLFSGPHGEKEYGRTPGWAGAFFYLTSLGKEVAASMMPTYPRH